MKKLLAIICCGLYLHSFSQAPIDAGSTSTKSSGQKVLIKAIAVIVNPEANKKTPVKICNNFSSECP